MPKMLARFSIVLLPVMAAGCVSIGPSVEPGPSANEPRATVAAKQADSAPMEVRRGLLTLHVDETAGRVWLELPESTDGEIGTFLHVEGLTAGLGSNPVGLDRGELGPTRLIVLRRLSGRLLIEEANLAFRAANGTREEQQAVRQSFASSVLWVGEIDFKRVPGKELVDLTPFLLRDLHGVVGRLQETDQGSFTLDPDRSVIEPEACLAFPDNVELEALLTYSSDAPGRLMRETVPTPESVTLVQHHSIIRLPDPGYRPRRFDPRAGSFEIRYQDYSAALGESIERRWIVRHRLERQDPASPSGPVVEPIVYYIDPAIPEPVRTAVLEGVGWWASAFEAAGFSEAFRVELLPAGAHPLDVRYNVVQWVHRSTRGWSYGGGVVDPRTGEMLKGHVRLGSLRVRQDRLLFEGLAGTERTGTGAADDPIELALARIRQLAAHEVGHTLGLAHNFAASTYAGRASVMDYPAPLVQVTDEGGLDFSDAYGVGVGAWDVHAIRYAYSQFADRVDESAALEELVSESLAQGQLFLTDDDARPPGAAQPLANLWDNGSDPVSQLEIELEVRRVALERFGEANVLPGTPLALLEEVLVPVYFHHRYQLAAALKVIGGVDYRYALRGDGQPGVRPIAAATQRRALQVLLRTLEPEVLDLPEEILATILPRPAGYERNREMFATEAAPLFDPLAAAATAAEMTVRGLLQGERAARLVDLQRRDPNQLGFGEVWSALIDSVFAEPSEAKRHRALRRRVESVVVRALVEVAAASEVSPTVRAHCESALSEIATRLSKRSAGEDDRVHAEYLLRVVRRFLERGAADEAPLPVALEIPPGDPIGAGPMVPSLAGCSWQNGSW